MDVLDLIVVTTALSAAVGGWRLGLLARATSWIGLAAGLVLAARVLPSVARTFEDSDPTSRLLVVAGLLIGGAFLGQALGLVVGAQFHRVLPPLGPWRAVDRALGATAGILGVAVGVWAIVPAMKGVDGWPSYQVNNSAIARAIDRYAPAPPDTLQALRRLVGDAQVDVFADLRPSHDVGPPPAATELPPNVVAQVSAATVKVSGVACRRIQEGSGFTAGPDTIVTNAHVVAGEDRTEVERPDGAKLRATVVVFDPNRDLAVLRVPGLNQPVLPVADAKRGDAAAVFGHPRGITQLRVSPARVESQVTAVGRDLYDSRDTRRDVFILAARLQPGDSGGALVDTKGAVVGVAFAIAPDRPDTAYALTSAELRPILAAPRVRPADTGPCLT